MKTICILCPQGCELLIDEKDQVIGNRCPKGKNYALQEKHTPLRTLTLSVAVKNGKQPRVSIKSQRPILKQDILEISKKLRLLELEAPLYVGQVLENPLSCGENMVVTSEVIGL